MGEQRDDRRDDCGEPGDGVGGPGWAALLDPVQGARALGEIQRRGLRAAGELVDRLITAVDGDAVEPETPTGGGAGPAPGSPSVELVRVWLDLVQRGLGLVSGAPGASPTGVATADLGAGTTTGTVRIRLDVRGRGATEVWLHNGTAEPIDGLALHCGELRAADGGTLPATALRFDPPELDELPARSSRGIVVEADAAATASGTYRGVILLAGAPDVWLPLEVTVAG